MRWDLFAGRLGASSRHALSLEAEQLRQRTPLAMRSPHSLTVVPVEVVRCGALLVAAGLLGTALLRWTSHRAASGAPRGSSRVCFGCVLFMLESDGVDYALARVALLDTDLLLPSFQLGDGRLAPFNFCSFQLCLYIGGWGAFPTRVRTDDEG